ncbi:MAG: Yip1 family protein [Gemmatimonadales bacterium]
MSRPPAPFDESDGSRVPDRADGLGRARRLLLSPREEWRRIARERPDDRSLWLQWVMPLAAIGPLAGLVGGLVFGAPAANLVGIDLGAGFYWRGALAGFLGALLGVVAVATLARLLAARFGATCDGRTGLTLAAYSFTAAWLAGTFALVPTLAPLGLLGLYSIYLLNLGARELTGVSDDRALGYTAALVVGGVIAALLPGWLFA